MAKGALHDCKGVANAKPHQRSITSFFVAPAQKRKAPEKEESSEDTKQDATEEAGDDDKAKAVKKTKRSEDNASPAPTPKAKSTEAAAKAAEEEEDEPEAVVEPAADDDVEMEKAAEISDDEDEVVEKRTPMKSKPGRRRLRQRQVEESDEDDDEDFGFPSATTTKERGVVVNLASSEDEENEKPVAEKKKKESAVAAVVAPREEDPAASVDAKDEPSTESPSKVKAKDKIKESKDAGKLTPTPAKKKSQSVDAFFTAHTPEKAITKSTDESKNDVKSNGKTVSDAADVTAATATEANGDENTSIPYSTLAHMFNTIEATSSRLAIQDLLIKFFRDVIRRAPQDLLACIYLCVCTDLAPPFENLKIGIGDAILMKAIGEATGTNMKFIKDMYQKEGDLGKVAQNARSKQHTLSFASMQPASAAVKKPSVFGVQDVYNQFVKIAKMTGNNSQQQKCSIIKSLLVKCEKDRKQEQTKGSDQQGEAAEGAKYIIRGLQGKLRIGLAEKSILIGLTYAFMQEEDQADKEKQQIALASVKKAFAECPSYNALVTAFREVQEEVPTRPLLRVKDFAKVAERCVLTPGTPVSPMLARPTKAYAMVFDRFQGMPFTCEYKYDGERAQIHILPNGEIAIFSRNFENSTERFPDVKLMIAKAAKKSNLVSCIVDAEVVAVDKATNKRLPFQILSTRSRKNVKVEDIKVPVCIYAFDLLFLNGESYLTKTLAERRAKLKEVFELEDGSFELASSIDIDAIEDIKDDAEAMEVAVDKVRAFLEEAVKEQCEGLMVKTLHREATYEPANRSHKWLKLKKDYLDGIGDSTDLVPIGAFFGRGKRTGVYGAYLLACYDPDTEMYQPITKLGTGLSDEVLKTFYEQLKEKVVDKTPRDYATGDGINPDVWFEPTVVWEILGADLSISPKYTAAMGIVARDKGISLRFPRFIRIRDDKSTTQATTSNQIADLYRAQGLATVSGGAEEDDDDMLI